MGADIWLSRVEERLAEVVSTADVLAQAQQHLVQAPMAKRLRPRAVALFAEIVGVSSDPSDAALVDDAVGVELIHTASLLHDDVVDHARARRGRPSANALFSDGVAVLAGDELLAKALRLFSPGALPAAIDAVAAMAQAALLEVQIRGRADATPEQCMRIMDGKTAALFSLCGHIAGCRADADSARRMARAGRALGRAFQIKDDVDDLVRDDAERGNDIRERTPTLPLTLLAETDGALSRELAVAWRALELGEGVPHIDTLVERVAHSGGPARALAVGAEEVRILEDLLAPSAHTVAHAAIMTVARGLATLGASPAHRSLRGAA